MFLNKSLILYLMATLAKLALRFEQQLGRLRTVRLVAGLATVLQRPMNKLAAESGLIVTLKTKPLLRLQQQHVLWRIMRLMAG